MKEIIVNGINLRLANPELGLREGMYYVSRKIGLTYQISIIFEVIKCLNNIQTSYQLMK